MHLHCFCFVKWTSITILSFRKSISILEINKIQIEKRQDDPPFHNFMVFLTETIISICTLFIDRFFYIYYFLMWLFGVHWHCKTL